MQVLPSAPPGTYSNSQLGSQPHSQQGSGGQGGGNIQASIAAARAIAARQGFIRIHLGHVITQ